MQTTITTLGSISGIILLLGFIKYVNVINNRTEDKVNGKFKDVVFTDTCHTAVTGMKDSITTLERHMDKRFDDMVILIKNGGK